MPERASFFAQLAFFMHVVIRRAQEAAPAIGIGLVNHRAEGNAARLQRAGRDGSLLRVEEMTVVFVESLIPRVWPLKRFGILCKALEAPFRQLAPCLLRSRILTAFRFLQGEIYDLRLLSGAVISNSRIPALLIFIIYRSRSCLARFCTLVVVSQFLMGAMLGGRRYLIHGR